MSRPLSSNSRPFHSAQWVVVQVQAGSSAEMRRANQGASPSVPGQRCTSSGGWGRRYCRRFRCQVALALEHDGLAVAADVGDQLHARERACGPGTAAVLGQGVVVAGRGTQQEWPT